MLPGWFPDTVTPDLDRALHYTLLWGLEGIVLRTVGRRGDRVPHVNETKLKRRLAEQEIAPLAADPGLFEGRAEERSAWLNDLATLPEPLAFCDRIGCRNLLVGALPGDEALAAEPLRRAAEAAARYGVTLAVRNETGARPTATDVAALLDAIGRPGVQACWSPADALEAGEAALDGLRALGGRVGLVVVRDGSVTAEGWVPRPLGEGAVGWEDVLRGLHALGYDGPLCLDLRDLEAPSEGLAEATTLIRLTRRVRRG